MLTHEDLVEVLAEIGAVAPVRAEEVTGSTSADAWALAAEGAPEWTLVSAAHQTAGRGRLGRTWEDRADHALLASFVLRPALAPAQAGLLSLLTGACMAEAIRATASQPVVCKWPNDLLLREAKVGGVLLTSAVDDDVLRHVVVGVGVNLEAPEGVGGAGAIGARTTPRDLLGAFLVRFAAMYRATDPPLAERVRSAWLPVAGTIGQVVRATTVDGTTVVGTAEGIDDDGALVVATDDGPARVGFGDVEHLREA